MGPLHPILATTAAMENAYETDQRSAQPLCGGGVLLGPQTLFRRTLGGFFATRGRRRRAGRRRAGRAGRRRAGRRHGRARPGARPGDRPSHAFSAFTVASKAAALAPRGKLATRSAPPILPCRGISYGSTEGRLVPQCTVTVFFCIPMVDRIPHYRLTPRYFRQARTRPVRYTLLMACS